MMLFDIVYTVFSSVVKGGNIIYDVFLHRIAGLHVTPIRKAVDWRTKVKGLLKAELKRRGHTYADLTEKLSAIGIHDNERNISNKIVRGTFTAIFFIQCLEAIGCKTLHLDQD